MELKVSTVRDLKNNTISFEDRRKELISNELKEKEKKEKEKKSPYKNFIQFNKASYKAEDQLLEKSATAYRVFKFLIQNMDSYNAVMCSYTVLEENLNISNSTVKRAIRLLKTEKFIDVYKSGTSNVYCINKNIVWSSWGTNFKYAKFGANIILSKTENKKD
ncbi:MAG: replication/maintenance protein RepL [Clostridium sp.]|uniref:replication/maintenance protein RepL n=1 Tax=Clostridium sp. TaxID=1506 RepID=UPI003EE56FB9